MLALAVIAATLAAPQQLYVAPAGSDSWPGSIDRPFATLQRAQEAVRERTGAMQSDIVVNVRAGTYRLRAPLRVSAGESGRNGHRVIYQAFGYGTPAQERVAISGGRRIARWRRAGRDLWRAPVGDLETRQLYVGGRRANRAARGSGLPGKVKLTRTGYVTTSAVPRTWRRPRDIEFVYTDGAFGFAEARCGVAGISRRGRSTAITMDQPCFRWARRLYRDPAEKLEMPPVTDVENSPSFLRRPNTWYLDHSRHMLWYRGSKPRHVVAPVLESLLTGEGLHDISLRGFTFADTTWLAPNEPTGFPHIYGNMYYAGGPVKPGGEVKDATIRTMPGSVAFRAARRVAIEDNRFTGLGALGLELSHGIADSVIQGNVVNDIAGGGIWVGAMNHDAIDRGANNHGNRIANNWVHHIGIDYPAIGIGLAQAADSTVAHNQVNATPYSGIVALNVPHDDVTQRVQIVDNRVFDTNDELIDGGAIYLNGRQGSSFETGAVVRGNVVSDANSPVTGDNGFVPIGLYTDDRSDWITLQGNVAYGNYRTFGGVMPKRVHFAGNFWDEDRPGWYPRGSGKTATFAGNALLPKARPREACAAIPACAAVLATAGLELAYRHLLRRPR